MRRRAPRSGLAVLAVLVALATQTVGRPSPVRAADSDLIVSVQTGKVQIQNHKVFRKWRSLATGFVTTSFLDARTGKEWVAPAGSSDFTINVGPVAFTSRDFTMTSAEQAPLANGGVRVTMHLTGPALFSVDEIVDAYPEVAGFRTQLVIKPVVALVVSSYTMGEVTTPLAASLTPVAQTFHSGSDWRDEDGWEPQLQIGGENTPRAGRSDWRVETTGPKGGPYKQYGNWISARHDDGSSLFAISERPNLPSSQVSFQGGRLAAEADLSKDIIGLGPIEGDVHIENPTPVPVRHRLHIGPAPFPLEPAFTGLATSPDDEPWQYAKYLQAGGWSYRHDITFNTNTIDDDSLPSNQPGGAKDSVDQARFLRLLPNIEAMGIETFIFDDGWQENSGDWVPDPTRFPNGFRPLSDLLESRGMHLGLWMSPMAFHPNSTAFRTHPEWACIPVGLGTGLANATPLGEAALGGSAEAGIGLWNPNGPSHEGKMIVTLEKKIERAITDYGSRYFKFDFLVWLDCLDAKPTDMYRYRETFVAMIDRLHARHPEVTFQIDETNDYRMWPFESVVRGPSWFQNGSPDPNQLLHNLWIASPYVPAYSLGQAVAASKLNRFSVDYVMATGMLSHMTFWLDVEKLSPAEVSRIRFWTDLYKANRDELGDDVVYPLGPDPFPGTSWVGLQSWNPDLQRGFLFAYRQGSPAASTTFALRNLRTGATYQVTDLVTGAVIGTFTAAQLQAGLLVSAPTTNAAQVLRIVRV